MSEKKEISFTVEQAAHVSKLGVDLYQQGASDVIKTITAAIQDVLINVSNSKPQSHANIYKMLTVEYPRQPEVEVTEEISEA